MRGDVSVETCPCERERVVSERGRPRGRPGGAVRGPLSERRAARLPALAGRREALQRGAGALRLGDAVRRRRRLHLHRRTRQHVGTGEEEARKTKKQ